MFYSRSPSVTSLSNTAGVCRTRRKAWAALVIFVIFIAVLGVGDDALATDATSLPAGGAREAEDYGGIVTNQTVTVAGHDFFNYFVSAWRDRELGDRYSISIHERPSPRWGSQVWVEYAQRRVFQVALPGGRAGMRLLGEQAVEIALQRIVEIDVERLLFREADIGMDEI